MIDLHAHLLPAIDDGAATLEEAVEMCRLAAADGVEAIVATPHQRHDAWPNGDRDALVEVFSRLQQAVGAAPRLLLGAEIRVDSDFLAEVEALPGGALLPLAGSRYLLLEFPPLPAGPAPREIVHELLVAGWFPVVAHPERTPWLAEEPEALAGLAELGALLQLTAMSVTGQFGGRAQACSAYLLDAGLAAFVASDAHDAGTRQPRLGDAYRAVSRRWGEETAARLMVDNPAAVLADRPLEDRT